MENILLFSICIFIDIHINMKTNIICDLATRYELLNVITLTGNKTFHICLYAI